MTSLEPSTTFALAEDAPSSTISNSKQTVDPWNVAGEIGADGVAKAINYLSLIEDFGTKRILAEDIARFEEVTRRKAHRFIRRGIVFSHRDLNLILDRHERGESFFLYTGRGPSSDSMHIGHSVPFEFTKWLQDVFDVPLMIMLTDDEKFIFGSESRTRKDVMSYTEKNAKDIIAIGFDPKKTFMFSDYEYMGGGFYGNVTEMSKRITRNVADAVFGFDGSSNIGKIHFAAVQGATAFASSFPHIFGEDEESTRAIPCLIPCAIDQDPYFRVCRDVAPRMDCAKPALLHASFLPALQGPGSKMSASVDASAIFMTDDAKKIKNKVNKNAFSGGRTTEEDHRKFGGDPEADVSFQYLTFFLEDDEELERIRKMYASGEMLTGELKAICIGELQAYVKGFQERRAKVTDDVVKDFMSRKVLQYSGNPNPITVAKEEIKDDAKADVAKGPSLNQLKKAAKLKRQEEEKAAKFAAKAAERKTSSDRREEVAKHERILADLKKAVFNEERALAEAKERLEATELDEEKGASA